MTELRGDLFDVATGTPGYGAAMPAPPPAPPPPPSEPLQAHRPGRSLGLAAAVVAVLIAGVAVGVPLGILSRGGSPSPSSSASPAPSGSSAAAAAARALYQQVVAAANGAAGVHYVATSTGGNQSQHFVGDAGQDGGTQAITMSSTYGPEQFRLVLVSGTVYFQGNGPAVQDQLGVPAASAPGLVGKWISVSSGDGPYGVLAPGITVDSQMQGLGFDPTSITPNATGTRILGTAVQQDATGPAHLDVASRTHLPISYVAKATANGTSITSTTTFSAWGTAPTVNAPSGAVAWSTLGASEPPGGYGSGGSISATAQA